MVSTKSPKAKTTKVATLGKCLCGCGKSVKGQFAQGHDAKLHSKVLDAIDAGKKLPAALIKTSGAYIKSRWPKLKAAL